MRKTVSVSFEGDKVKIVYASFKGNTLSITKTDVIPDDEFELYLRKDKSAEYKVTCQFMDPSHDVITVPSVKAAYLNKLVESEIRKLTGKKDFTFIAIPLGKKTADNRKVQEVFFYAVNNIEIRNLLDRFYRCGKSVKALYPAVFAAASLTDPAVSGEASMGVMGSERARTIFLTRAGAVQFIRNYDSIESDFGSFDVQNVNMTINYCFQNLRLNPSSVLLVGHLTECSDAGMLPTAPLSSLLKPATIGCSQDDFNEFMLPIAACFTEKSSNIMSRDFRNIYMTRKYMAFAAALFIAVAALCALFMISKAQDISTNRDLLAQARANMQDIEVVAAEYNDRSNKLDRYRPAVEFLNQTPPSIHSLMLSLSAAGGSDYKFSYFTAKASNEDSFRVTLNGAIYVDTFSSLHDVMTSVMENLKSLDGASIQESSMDTASNSFRIVIEYRNPA